MSFYGFSNGVKITKIGSMAVFIEFGALLAGSDGSELSEKHYWMYPHRIEYILADYQALQRA